jgi:hypothetical protein
MNAQILNRLGTVSAHGGQSHWVLPDWHFSPTSIASVAKCSEKMKSIWNPMKLNF